MIAELIAGRIALKMHAILRSLIVLSVFWWVRPHVNILAAKHVAIQTPVLKWEHGGCYSSWCETGWYSSPAVADLDGDGSIEVVGSAYSIFAVNGTNGTLKWQIPSGHDRSQPGESSVGRTWPGIVIADLDENGDLEIASAHSGGYVSVYDHQGFFEPGWPQNPTGSELRGLSVYDLDSDGDLEVIVTAAVSNKTNTWIYEHNGFMRAGWPQLDNDSGYAWGVFNDNAAIGNLNADPFAEIVIPSDVHYICAYTPDGIQLGANPIYGDKAWGKVGVWESLETELRGWGTCASGDARSERYRPNFAHGASAIADMDGDGRNEVVVTGNVYDCIDGYPSQYTGVYIINADRSRFRTALFDWETPPVDTGYPLSEDYNLIENVQPNPVVVDLDSDGHLEILFPSYDGRLHAFWLDKSEHGSWPFSVYSPNEGTYRFASEPAVADLDNDGLAEVIFTSWVEKGTHQTGKLHLLDYLGHVLYEIDLPSPFGSASWNGALPAPTLADIDRDPDLEIVVNTAHSGLVAYDLPGTANARVLWGTGRGSYQRTGAILQGNLLASSKSVNRSYAVSGDMLSYKILLVNSGLKLDHVKLEDNLPAGSSYAGGLWASSGSYQAVGNQITWNGPVTSSKPITITFNALIDIPASNALLLNNIATIDDGLGNKHQVKASTFVNSYGLFFPLTFQDHIP